LGRTSFCSSKDASCADVSQTESEKDMGDEQWHQPTTNHFVEHLKWDDRRAEQFAKTKVCVVLHYNLFSSSFSSHCAHFVPVLDNSMSDKEERVER
jgi:hypothetical protein